MIKQLENLPSIKTSHGYGEKNVFVTKQDVLTNLTQVAVGKLTEGDIIESHKHPTMEEYYFFLDGKAIFTIDCKDFECKKNTFVLVPINVMHCLKTKDFVKFIYWGVSI